MMVLPTAASPMRLVALVAVLSLGGCTDDKFRASVESTWVPVLLMGYSDFRTDRESLDSGLC